MNYGAYICLILAIVYGVSSFILFLLRDKGAMLISGFNMLSKEERELYDKARLSKDQRNDMIIWTIIMGVGSLLSHLLSQYFAIIAFAVWLILFLKDVRLDDGKAFEQYKLK